jgi:hypothetical protein
MTLNFEKLLFVFIWCSLIHVLCVDLTHAQSNNQKILRAQACDRKNIYSHYDLISNTISLHNCYVKCEVHLSEPAITYLAADFHGNMDFKTSVFSEPFQLNIYPSSSSKMAKHEASDCITKHDLKKSISSAGDIASAVLWIESFCESHVQSWSIEISSLSLQLLVHVDGMLVDEIKANHMSYAIMTPNPYIAGFFKSPEKIGGHDGVLQMMNGPSSCLGTTSELLHRALTLGDGAALEILDDSHHPQHFFVFHSMNGQSKVKSGIELVIGENNFPYLSKNMSSAWNASCWDHATEVSLAAGSIWEFSLTFLPNDYNFPVYPLRGVSPDLSSASLPFLDLQTILTAIYTSPVGCLQSYYQDQEGIIAPTIAHPDIGYSPDANFFDPDNFFSLTAMLYAGDDFLTGQVKQVLRRTASTMCGIGDDQDPSYCDLCRQRMHHRGYLSQRHSRLYGAKASSSRSGQLMHHFIDLVPTYLSIAGSEQLGPNIFWSLTVSRYVSLTQDTAFAAEIFPYIDLSTKFILSFIDTDKDLVVAPGPLWIDVLVRENYTSDSNAMMVEALREIADLYDYCSTDTAMAKELRDLSARIIIAMNRYLWAPVSSSLSPGSGPDHLLTQLNMDMTSYRDFIDYDANLLAVAFGVIADDRVDDVLNRVDQGPYTHIRATWCSEIAYSGNASDCYIVGGSVCGDSVVSLARIGWADALARKRVHDVRTINDVIISPLQNDLIRDTWLYERYNATGKQIRTPYYFEYPSLLVILLREIVYGIDVKLNSVTINPMMNTSTPSFAYHIGNTRLAFNQRRVEISLPGNRDVEHMKACRIDSLIPLTSYKIRSTCRTSTALVESDRSGSITFAAIFGHGCTIEVTTIS